MATPLHRRPNVTIEQLQAKRFELINRVASKAHESTVVTRDYGPHDPRIAPFPVCTCGSPGKMEKLASGRWTVSCSGCDKRIREDQQYDWAACLYWCLLNLEQIDYHELPLFGLQGLSKPEAKARLTSIYNDLLLRSQIVTLDLALNPRTHEHPAPGRDFLEKMWAYRDWAKFALSLIKQETTPPN